jgi:Flp pilus assembly protein TadG
MTGRQHRRRRQVNAGQALVEFALVLPLFLLMLFAMVDIGRVIWANDNLANAAREGARWASVHGNWKLAECQTGPSAGTAPPIQCTPTTPDYKEPTRVHARGFLVAPGSDVVIYVCYFYTNACSLDADEAGASNARGGFVTVTATSTVQIITGSLLGMGSFPVSSSSTVVINN